MKHVWQVFQGIIIAVLSIGLISGGFSLSMAEGKLSTSPTPPHTLTPTSSPTLRPSITATTLASLTPTLDLSATPAFTFTPSLTPSLSPSPTTCPPPTGWIQYVVQPGDTFALIAARYRTNPVTLQHANCLPATGLNSGLLIYVPPLPTKTPIPCGAPFNWITYIVQPGDTLYHLSLSYGVTVGDLQRANCMGSSDLLHTGQRLYVPPWAPVIPPPTSIPTETPTPDFGLPSDTPTEAALSTATDTPVPVASDTPIEIPTDTSAPALP